MGINIFQVLRYKRIDLIDDEVNRKVISYYPMLQEILQSNHCVSNTRIVAGTMKVLSICS